MFPNPSYGQFCTQQAPPFPYSQNPQGSSQFNSTFSSYSNSGLNQGTAFPPTVPAFYSQPASYPNQNPLLYSQNPQGNSQFNSTFSSYSNSGLNQGTAFPSTVSASYFIQPQTSPVYASCSSTHLQTIDPDIQEIKNRASRDDFVHFYDDQTDPITGCFGNFHSCLVWFNGIQYSNSEAAFQGQKFIDQPSIFAQFSFATTPEAAVKMGRQYQMTPNRHSQWESIRVDIMMNVLRAKFNQDPLLKDKLLATQSAFLIEHLPDPYRKDRFWSDGYDGTGQNKLGECLMELRQEYGGTGIVLAPLFLHQTLKNSHLRTSPNVVFNPVSFQQQVPSPNQQCMVDGCVKVRYPGYHFCSKTHGQNYMNLYGRCTNCQQQPKYADKNLDGTIQKIHAYCSRTCANLSHK